MAYEFGDEMHWYVAHTYSGYEKKVKSSIESTVESRQMESLFENVRIPIHKYEETKDGKTTIKEKLLFPGYVFVKMMMTDESWYVVRNTRGVTGFVGPASKPVPLSFDEIEKFRLNEADEELEVTKQIINYEIGEEVEVLDGPMIGYSGIIESIDKDKQLIRVNISMFNRDTPTELRVEQIKKL